jgi:anthranilate phosphoribosyltransferase
MSEIVRSAIARVVGGGSLSRAEAQHAMGEVMDGAATPAQLAGLLMALRMRTETVDELAGFALAMRARVVAVTAPLGAIDTCGTGGDGAGSFNISTAAALVAAAAGVPVAKHGNRAVTSATGSADVLEALGIPIDHGPADAADALARDGFCFMFAPAYHPAMRHAGPVRRELGVPTCFNLLGPLTNPAAVRRQVMGVADPRAAARVAQVLHALGAERALVVHGDGVDELPLDGSGIVHDVSAAGVRRRRVDGRTFGLLGAGRDELRGGDAATNAAIIEAVLDGQRGAHRDVVLLNAGAALLVAGRTGRMRDGVDLAAAVIDSGQAKGLLARLRATRPQASAARPQASAA